MNLATASIFLSALLLPGRFAWAGGTNWSWAISGSTIIGGGGTFTACEANNKVYLSGSYARPASGFLDLEPSGCQLCSDSNCSTGCTTSTSGACASIPSDIYGIEVPGLHTILQPVLSSPAETQPIYLVSTGSCPTHNMTTNFVFSQWSAANNMSSTSQIGVGRFTWATNGTATVTNAWNVQDYTSIGLNFTLPNSGCTSGTIPITGTAGTDRNGTIYITDKNEFFYSSAANHALFGVPQIAISNTNDLSGLYSGFVYDASGSNTVTPLINVTVGLGGTQASGYRMSSSGTQDNSFQRSFSFTSSGVNQPSPGMVEGTFSDGTNSSNAICITSLGVNGYNNLFCAGQEPGATSTPYNMLLTSAQSWTWVAGSSLGAQLGNYGTKSVPASTNVPPTRSEGASWVDHAGNLWMFGGYGGVLYNDVWKFDGTNWTWVAGGSASDQPGSYGQQGIAASGNLPGTRETTQSTVDASGNFWIMGGFGWDASSSGLELSDLWKYDGTNWTWISGGSVGNQFGSYGQKGIASGSNVPGARDGGALWVDASGHLQLFGGSGYAATAGGTLNDFWKYDGTNWTWVAGSSVADPTANYGQKGVAAGTNDPGGREVFAKWVDASGNLWIFGGLGPGPGLIYYNDLWKYDGTNWTWISGSSSTGQTGVYGTKGTPSSSNFPGARAWPISWIDASGNLWLLGGDGYDSASQGILSDLWKYDGTNWTWVSGSSVITQAGTYGTKGTPASSNDPGMRYDATSWLDNSGRVWIFGGDGAQFDNDLWRGMGFAVTSLTALSAPRLSISDGPTYDFGTPLSSVTHTFTLASTGGSGGSISSLSASTLSSPFSFVGGYPGAGGTCSSTLSDGETCTVVVTCAAQATTSTSSSNLSITYDNGTSQIASVGLRSKGNIPPDPSNLTAKDDGASSTVVSWTAAGGSTASYVVAYAAGTTAPADCSSGSNAGSSTSYTVSGLTNTGRYSFRVCSQNANGANSSGITTTTPADPTGLGSVTSGGISTGQIKISWTNPSPTPSGYYVSWKAGASAPTNCTTDATGTKVTIGTTSPYILSTGSSTITISFRLCSYDSSGNVSLGASLTSRSTR